MSETETLKALNDARAIALELICDPDVGYMWCRVFYRIEEQIYAIDPLNSPFPFTKVKRTLNEQIVLPYRPQAKRAEITKADFIEEIKGGRY